MKAPSNALIKLSSACICCLISGSLRKLGRFRCRAKAAVGKEEILGANSLKMLGPSGFVKRSATFSDDLTRVIVRYLSLIN